MDKTLAPSHAWRQAKSRRDCRVLAARVGEAVPPEQGIELPARHAEQPRGLRLVVPGVRQRLPNEIALDRFQLHASGRQPADWQDVDRRGAGPCGGNRDGQMISRDEPTFTEDDRALDRVLQLTDVTGPCVSRQLFARVLGNSGSRPADAVADFFQERLRERQDVLWSQRNTRLGVTLSVPIARQQSLKFVYSTGATTRRGSDFNTFNVTWQLVSFTKRAS
jgi:hypothetical protein